MPSITTFPRGGEMRDGRHDTCDVLDRILDASDVDQVWDSFRDWVALHGFDRLFYAATRYRANGPFGDIDDAQILTNYGDDYVERYVSVGHFHNAPMAVWVVENVGVLSWSEIGRLREAGRLTPKMQDVVAFNQKMGILAGVTISFPRTNERTLAGLAICAQPGLHQSDVDALWAVKGDVIHRVARVMHLKLSALPQSVPARITPRQAEVLRWVGDGKSVADVAAILGVSTATVDKHLRLAREALNVSTTAQAVMKLALRNAIFLPEKQSKGHSERQVGNS